jgi:hypothetical protein
VQGRAAAGRRGGPVGRFRSRRLRRRRRHRGPARGNLRRPGRGGRGRAGWGPGPVPGSDHEAEVEVSVERPTTAPSAASRSAAPTALARSTSPSRRAWSTVSGSGCAARAARAAVRRQPETSTWWSGSPTTRVTGSRVATCTHSCRSLRGRQPWALRSPSTLPEAPPR